MDIPKVPQLVRVQKPGTWNPRDWEWKMTIRVRVGGRFRKIVNTVENEDKHTTVTLTDNRIGNSHDERGRWHKISVSKTQVTSFVAEM